MAGVMLVAAGPARLGELLPSAAIIAFLAGVESLLSAVEADGMTGRRYRSNCELVAQGIANLASALMGGIPATGVLFAADLADALECARQQITRNGIKPQ